MPRKKSPRQSLPGRTGRRIRYAVLVTGTSLLAMALSYHAAQWYLRESDRPILAPATPASEAKELQGFSQELTTLVRDYLDRAPQVGNPPGDGFVRWTADVFTPRINELRRRIQASRAQGAAVSVLLDASDRVAAMARQPENQGLRQTATDAVMNAAGAVEDRLATLGLAPPPLATGVPTE
ncbi:MAG: hypothetical protein IT365_12530 [Candidatus Hydrogenedentes bacterium]|nr:hypothetical protein [Candidatus Hydrogenedentota bacterium]